MKKYYLIILCILTTLSSISLAVPTPAHFDFGQEVKISTTKIGPQGGVIKIDLKGSPLDGFEVKVPAGAVKKEVELTLSYNTGKLTVNKGTPSNAFIRLSSNPLPEFQEPINFTVKFDPVKWKGHMPVPYIIEENGSLSSLTPLTFDDKEGRFTFDGFVPGLMTWVYTPLHL